MNAFGTRQTTSRGFAGIIAAALIGSFPAAQLALAGRPSAPAAKPAVTAAKPATAAAKPAAAASKPAAAAGRGGAATGVAGRGAASTGGRGGAATSAGRGAPATATGRGTVAPAGGRGATPGVVHAHGMEIHNGPGGSQTVVRERADRSRVVSDRFGHGYVARPYGYRGAAFVHRTYYRNGFAYARVYRPYVWGGVPLEVYAPGFYFAPAFYSWAYTPWATPIAFGWGWAGNPWYAYYGGYFTPYPVYASPSLWLTDYLVAQTLQAAYTARAAELANQQANFTPMTPDVKQAIATEVGRQIALENAEAAAGVETAPDPGSSGIARMLSDNKSHVFLVSAGLDVPSNAGQCAITEGDVLQLMPGTPANATTANLAVLASKGRDCPKGSAVTVGIADLQDMQNHMRETLDLGLADLQKKQGQGGVPAAPSAATAPPVQTAFAAIAPPPDPNVASELSAQTKEAEQAEREALQGPSGALNPLPNSAPAAAAAAPTAHLELGLEPDQVVALLGQPKSIADMGTKKIYVFKDLKVTFTDGKASAIQ